MRINGSFTTRYRPAAIFRAIRLNGKAGRVVSGGSTLTMQLARIARGNQDRTFYEKTIEMCWALFLETTHSKQEILKPLCLARSLLGGNVIGLETAAWRYFGRSASELSWAESATLAVLPNSPALIHPGRNRKQLKEKRDRLLAPFKRKVYWRKPNTSWPAWSHFPKPLSLYLMMPLTC